MPVGIIVDSIAILLGGFVGGFAGHKVPSEIKIQLNLIFGLSSMLLGITSMGLVQNISTVIFLMILGTIVGVSFKLGHRINQLGLLLERPVTKLIGSDHDGLSREEFLTQLVTVIVLFCFGGTGIYASLDSGMTGDHSVLIAKSILDFFTAAIFACNIGYVVSLVAIPQFAIFFSLYLIGAQIFPLTDPVMLADFRACGGVIMLATGMRIAKVKMFPVADMLPAMVFIMPISWGWVHWILPLISQ